MSAILDTIIVGGGPAGLSAALVLGRCLRNVVVCDAGNPRNAPARIFNGYLSRDGSTPAEFLDVSRAQLCRYETVQLRKAVAAQGSRTHDLRSHRRAGPRRPRCRSPSSPCDERKAGALRLRREHRQSD